MYLWGLILIGQESGRSF